MDAYDVGYDEGHKDGYNEGHARGYKDGENDGYEAGQHDGYKQGHADGVSHYDALFDAVNEAYPDWLAEWLDSRKED